LADHCYRKVSEGVATALAGRLQRYLEPAAEKAPAEAAAMDPDPSPLPSPGA
jgi:hypothetical protein